MQWKALSAVLVATLGLVACGGGGGDAPAPGPGPVVPPVVTVGDTVALTASGRLVSFNRSTPATQMSTVATSGLAAGETLLGIDRRPADGGLYGLGSSGTVYLLDPATGAATAKSTLRAVSGDDAPFVALSGSNFGVDFNPTNDRLRVVSDTGQNLRINVDTGATTTDTTLHPAGSAITAAAYTNAFDGAPSSQLFVLDAGAGRVFQQNPQNDGTLDAGVSLGVTGAAANGFDIDPRTNIGYAALQTASGAALYTIDLDATANAATRVDAIAAGGEAIRGLALAAVTPSVVALTSDNRLLSFDPRTPNTIASNVAITGLAAGESLGGIDVRPRDQLLYGVSDAGRLYTIDPASGRATLRATLVADPSDSSAPFAGIGGTITVVDFNPANDRLRVLTSTGQNLRVTVQTETVGGATATAGEVTTEAPLNSGSGRAVSVVAGAHSNNFAGAASSTLFDLEQNADVLASQSPVASGTLVDRGPLGVNVTGAAGFDIGGGGNLALAALRTGTTGPFSLFGVSLSTGAATLFGDGATNPALAVIGGAGGPSNLVDLAIRF